MTATIGAAAPNPVVTAATRVATGAAKGAVGGGVAFGLAFGALGLLTGSRGSEVLAMTGSGAAFGAIAGAVIGGVTNPFVHAHTGQSLPERSLRATLLPAVAMGGVTIGAVSVLNALFEGMGGGRLSGHEVLLAGGVVALSGAVGGALYGALSTPKD